MKKLMIWLTALLMLAGAALAEVLPAPPWGTGEWVGTATDDDGVTYKVYQYQYAKESSSFTTSVMTWYKTWIEGEGFTFTLTAQEGESFKTFDWYEASAGNLTAIITFESSYFGTSETITIYVPEGMGFPLDPDAATPAPHPNFTFTEGGPSHDDAPGDALNRSASGFLNGSLLSGADVPSSGSGPVVCRACHGSKKCGTCDGKGYWKNPYTGDWLQCNSCVNGVCSVCDGTGYWD